MWLAPLESEESALLIDYLIFLDSDFQTFFFFFLKVNPGSFESIKKKHILGDGNMSF